MLAGSYRIALPHGHICASTSLAFFPEYLYFSPPVAGLPSRFRLRGTQGARVYATGQMRASAEVRGACSWPPKSRMLANNYGEPFPPARAKPDNGNPTTSKDFPPAAVLLAAAVGSRPITPPLELSTTRQPRNSGSRSPSSSFCCDGHGRRSFFSVCVRMWAVIHVDLGSRNERIHNLKKGEIGCCAGGQDRNSYLIRVHKISLYFLKQPRSHGTHYGSSSSCATAVFACMCVQRSPGDTAVVRFFFR